MTPEFVALDFETSCSGEASIDYWHHDFRVVSLAASWPVGDTIESAFYEGENAAAYFLARCAQVAVPIVAHNFCFEFGVVQCRFPEIPVLNWLCDTMRLVQVYDGGGDAFVSSLPPSLDDEMDAALAGEEATNEWVGGLSLGNSVQRVLGRPNHKEPAYAYLRSIGVKNGHEGRSLHLLPRDRLEQYNVADTEETVRLYQHLTAYFARIGYDWRLDHQLYLSSARFIVGAQLRGVAVDRTRLATYAQSVSHEIEALGAAFTAKLAAPIHAVERGRLLAAIRKRKTLRGRKKFLRRVRNGSDTATREVRFNVGSNLQLALLFVGQLGMVAHFTTDKGAPSFKSSALSQWGPDGELLKTRRKRQLVMKQAEALLELSEADGRWHPSLKACGTATGRMAGGSAD